jgi:hypothetical protein
MNNSINLFKSLQQLLFSYKNSLPRGGCLLFVLFLLDCNHSNAQNLASNKSYTLSAPPNYAYSAPPTDSTSLTDGVYTTAHFWTSPTTVGWQRRQVKITIDLGSVQTIGAVTFNTARNAKVGLNFPKNVFLFVSQDNQNFNYVGDIVNTPDNMSGDYKIEKFTLQNVNMQGRYVMLLAVPKGGLFVCDEIEVLKGNRVNPTLGPQIAKDDIDKAKDSILNVQYNKNNLKAIAIQLKDNSTQDNALLSRGDVSPSNMETLKDNLLQKHASAVRSLYNASIIIEKYNPWDSLGELYTPRKVSDNLSYNFTVLQNDVQYGAFVITNSSNSTTQLSINVTNSNPSIQGIDIFKVSLVPDGDSSYITDPLIRVNTGTVNSGASALFFFKLTGKQAGVSNSTINVQAGTVQANVKINTKVLNLNVPNNYVPNANVWAYLTYPTIMDRKAQAVQDLAAHHVNTVVILPNLIPKLQDTGYSKLLNYLSFFPKTDKILLNVGYANRINKNGYNGGQFMSADWKGNFISWYTNLMKVLNQNGYSSSNVYLYPYDEVRENDINDFKTFVQWAKTSVSGVKFYATLTTEDAVNNILPLIDVAQIPSSLNLLQNLPSHTCELWIYGGSSPSRKQSAYGFYRLMSWKAFANDITGVGFWNYADEGQDKKTNFVSDILSDPKSSYSVIYNGKGQDILSTRRWEAFSLGIEDYSVMKLYAAKYGVQKAKALVNSVISNPTNTSMADATIKQMLDALK